MIEQTPATPSAEVVAMSAEWPMIEALLGGTAAMRAAGKAYLPQYPAEDNVAYNYRKSVSVLFNGFRRAVETLSAKPFAEPIKFGDDVPQQILDYCEDIDLEGRNLQAFAHNVLTVAMNFGLSHILVEFPNTSAGQSAAAERASGARPYLVHIRPQQVLGWKSERILGAETLTELRLDEFASEPDGAWLTKQVRQIRVLRRDGYEIYRKTDDSTKDEWYLYEAGALSIGFIPLVTCYTKRTAFMQAQPPLLDMAYLNVAHWQSDSDQQNITHVARVPLLFGAGFSTEGTTIISAGSLIKNDNPLAKLSYIEPTMDGAIEVGRQSIKDIEDRMSLMAAQPLLRKSVAITATEKDRDSDEADSMLSMIALAFEDALELALEYMAKWIGQSTGGSIDLCTDYGEGLDGLSVDDLLRARELGILSAQTVFTEMQRRGIISEEISWMDEQARLKVEGPPVPLIGSFETQGK